MRLFGFLLHQFPRLATGLARLETAFLRDQLDRITIDRPVYVTSLARSGTTILLELLASLPGVATHRYRDFPPVWTPYLWDQFLHLVPHRDSTPKERPHGDRIMITPESPEAMEEPLWMRFFPESHEALSSTRLDRTTRNDAFAAFYRNHIRKLLLARDGTRYLAKGNYNIARLAYIQELFPDARFIVPIRHPITHIASLMRQHQRFAAGQKACPAARAHLRRVGHFEFGLDRIPINMGDTDAIREIQLLWTAADEVGGWARYWSHVYASLRDQLDADQRLRQAVLVIRYEDLCERPAQELQKIFDHCGVTIDPDQLAAWTSQFQPPAYYEDGFSAADLERIIDMTAPTMQKYGYLPR
jgi:Sulfotransferase family